MFLRREQLVSWGSIFCRPWLGTHKCNVYLTSQVYKASKFYCREGSCRIIKSTSSFDSREKIHLKDYISQCSHLMKLTRTKHPCLPTLRPMLSFHPALWPFWNWNENTYNPVSPPLSCTHGERSGGKAASGGADTFPACSGVQSWKQKAV